MVHKERKMINNLIGGALIVIGLTVFASTAFVASAPKVKLERVVFGSGVLTPQHVVDWRFPEASPEWRN
jgi:hypothetical protein